MDNDLFYTLGFILRLPLFFLGFGLITTIVVPLAILSCLFGIIIVPFVFLKAAFRNDKSILDNHLENTFAFTLIKEFYSDLNKWLYKKQ